MLVGLVSTYREGLLAAEAVRSLRACCQVVVVADGPIGDAGEGGNQTDWSAFKRDGSVVVHHGVWETDAAKRTWLLEKTRRYPAPTWGMIVDGDELLLHGEQVGSVIEYRAAQAEAAGVPAINVPLRLVESDGSVGIITARVLRLDLVESWLISSYHILLRNGVEVSLPNVYPLGVGEPDRREIDQVTGMQIRRPLAGEPHILHRSPLRAPQRSAARQSKAEGSAFDALVKDAGLLEAHGEKVKDERSAIWLPQ